MAFRPVKLVALLALLTLAVVVTRNGLASAIASQNPSVALKLAPETAAALSARATELLGGGQAAPNLAEAKLLAGRAVAREAVNADALRTLGAIADAQANADLGRQLVTASGRLSRRDFIGQLWLIEDAVRQGRTGEALDHYDIALRTSRRAPDILFPVLGAAADDRALVGPIADVIARKPSWAESFLLYLVSTSKDLAVTTALFDRVTRRGYSASPSTVQTLIGRLMAADSVEDASHVYHLAHPHISTDIVRDPFFRASLAEPTPFDWSFTADGGAAATTSVVNGRSALSFEAPVGTGGVVAKQILLLQPGTAYRMVSTIHLIQAKGTSAPLWRLGCRDGRPISQMPLPNVKNSRTLVTPPFQLPHNCRSQWLELVVTATEQPEGVRGVVGSVRVMTANSSNPSKVAR